MARKIEHRLKSALRDQTAAFDKLIKATAQRKRGDFKNRSLPQSSLLRVARRDILAERREANHTKRDGQWHRWYQEQQKRNRRLRALGRQKAAKGKYVWSIERETVL